RRRCRAISSAGSFARRMKQSLFLLLPACAAFSSQQAQSATQLAGPTEAGGRPFIRKLGTIDLDMVETTPLVFRGKLWRFEGVRQGTGQQYWNNQRQTNYFRFRDPATGEVTPPFADGHEFGSALSEGTRVCITGTQGRSRVNLFASENLTN